MTGNVTEYLTFVANVHEKNGLPDGYVSPARWLLDHGRFYNKHATVPDWMKGELQSCYRNAGTVALLYEENGRYTYVEGYITCFGVPIQHAWLVDDEGRIFEVTIDDLDGIDDYFGAPIDAETLRKTVLRTKVWGVLDGLTNRELYRVEEAVT